MIGVAVELEEEILEPEDPEVLRHLRLQRQAQVFVARTPY